MISYNWYVTLRCSSIVDRAEHKKDRPQKVDDYLATHLEGFKFQ